MSSHLILDAYNVIGALDRYRDADDFDAARELLFSDHDVLLLFDPALDGIEAPDLDLDEHRLFANLHPRSMVSAVHRRRRARHRGMRLASNGGTRDRHPPRIGCVSRQ